MLSLALALTLLTTEAPRVVAEIPGLGGSVAERAVAAAHAFQQRPGPPSYAAEERAVANWRHEAAFALDPAPLSTLAALFNLDRPIVARCVKLNNYWCIKRAGWNGEIGSDEEGHTGFASADQGADAAATLLRRYYLEFGRKSALDVVRRWAPAECRTVIAGTALPGVLAVRGLANTLRGRWLAKQRRPSQPRRIRVSSAGGALPAPARQPQASPPPAQPSRTQALRARPQARSPAPRASAVPPRPLPTFRMPTIAAGVGEPKVVTLSATLAPRAPIRRQPTPASIAAAQKAMAARTTARLTPPATLPATLPAPARAVSGASAAVPKPQRMAAAPSKPAAPALVTAPKPQPVRTAAVAPAAQPQQPVAPTATDAAPPPVLPALRPVVSCASDEQRIQNYAARIVQGLGIGPSDDLKLFEPDGRPLPNLARVMLAMSSVELGVLRANLQLVEGAVARAALRVQPAAADAARPEPDAIPTPPI